MELSEFIKSSLVDVYTGLRKANEFIAKDEGGVLGEDKSAHFVMRAGEEIEFDVAVMVNEGEKSADSAGIKVAIFDIGGGVNGQSETNYAQQHASRIRFKVRSSLNTG